MLPNDGRRVGEPLRAAVRAWRDAAVAEGPPRVAHGLSPQGWAAVWQAAFDALTDEALDAAWQRAGSPYEEATMVVARTVLTAPLEWCALWWGVGTHVRLKVPREAGGLGPWLQEQAARFGLPLQVVTDPGAVQGPLVVAMGRDATIDALASALPASTRFVGFGHRFSVSWARTEAGLWATAADVAMHDTRGCLSPVAVFSDHPRAAAILAEAMAEAQARWPRGELADHELALLRQRRALARVVGSVAEGEGWAVHTVPVDRFQPVAAPRLAVLHPATHAQLGVALAPYLEHLSSVGTDSDDPLPGRVVPCGELQRPALARQHDGIDWVAVAVGAGRSG